MQRWLFMGLAVVIGLAVVEGGLRVAGYRPLPTAPVTRDAGILHQYGKFRTSRKLVWELVPGWSGREGHGVVRINSHGLREREIPVTKPPGRRRILCLGDSVTFGHWVEAEEAFPRRLEAILNRASDPDLEVINAGVPGYSTFQEAAWLEASGWDYEPDLLLVAFVLNDVVERYMTLAQYGGANTVLGVDTTVSLDPLRRLLRRTAFHRFVTSLMRGGARRREIYSVRRLFDASLSPEIARAWGRAEAELDSIAEAAESRGVPLLLVAFPFRFQVAEGLPSQPQSRLGEWAARRGVAFLDLSEAFAAVGAQRGFLDHDHPTVAGHLVAARAIAAVIQARRLHAGRETGATDALQTILPDTATTRGLAPRLPEE